MVQLCGAINPKQKKANEDIEIRFFRVINISVGIDTSSAAFSLFCSVSFCLTKYGLHNSAFKPGEESKLY